MRKQQRRSGESSQRSAQYIKANTAILGPLDTTPAFQQLTDANAQVTSLAAQQDAFVRDLSAHTAVDKQLAASLRTEHMLPIAKFARANLRGAPGYAALTRSGSNLRATALVAAATGMATAAAAFVPQLVEAQFPADTVDQLVAAANALAASLADRATARGGRVRATEALNVQLRRAREAVAMLDSIVTKKLATQPALLAEWRSAKRVTAAPTASDTSVPAVTPATTPAPASTAAPTQPAA